MSERRRSRRRSLPFVRSAVLEVGGRRHVVAVSDLGADGAFLSSGADVAAGEALVLRMILPRDGREVALPCRAVRRVQKPGPNQKSGIAVRFVALDPPVLRRIEEFAMEGFLPASEPVPADHYEYRLLERREIDLQELNQLGIDGWLLVTALPSGEGLKLVFQRRL